MSAYQRKNEMKKLLLSTIAAVAFTAAHADTLTITAPPAGDNFTAFNDYVGQTLSFTMGGQFAGDVLANGDLVHLPNQPLTGSFQSYVLLSPILNPMIQELQQRPHGANFTLTLDTPVNTLSVLMFDVEDANTVQFGIGADTVTVLGSQMVAAGFQNELITYTSDTPFDRLQVHDVDVYGQPDTFARFQIGSVNSGAVPETSTWLMSLMGFACIGFSIFRQRLTTVSRA